ncbi:MAG: DegT/DnrJ/EryC1/StrS family aminotransferase [Jatrophihabitantaceae bacterium]
MRVPFLDLPSMTAEVRSEVTAGWADLLDTSRFVGGVAVDRFEAQWAAYCQTSEAVGVANGTDAIQLTLRALGIGAGDEVIVPANSFVATAAAVVLAGARPRFADVEPETLLLDVDGVASAMTTRTRAVIAVHLYGQMADVGALGEAADRYGIALIEDAAQAHGARRSGRRAGAGGRAGCFSFYPGKNLGAFGDAGAVVTSDPALATRVRALRDHGRRDGGHYDHCYLGTNSRLDAVQAIVLSAKLRHLDRWNAARRAIVDRYRDALTGTSIALVAEAAGAYGVHHLAVVRVPQRAQVRHLLAERGIETGVHYPTPIHLLAPFRDLADRPLPVTESAAQEILSLPISPHLRPEQVEHVCRTLAGIDQWLHQGQASRV